MLKYIKICECWYMLPTESPNKEEDVGSLQTKFRAVFSFVHMVRSVGNVPKNEYMKSPLGLLGVPYLHQAVKDPNDESSALVLHQ